MITKVHTYSLLGIDAILVEVEVALSAGLPYLATVGLPDNIVRESKDRVKTPLQNSAYPFPAEGVTVSPALAHLKKEGRRLTCPSPSGFLRRLAWWIERGWMR